MCAKLTVKKTKHSSVTGALTELHWLPVRQRVTLKLMSIIHKCLYGTAPKYLKNLIVRTPATKYNLRSEEDSTLLINKTKDFRQ